MAITYTPITNFAAKDLLSSGNPSKLILGAQISAELTAIQAALVTAVVSGTFTGTLLGCTTSPTVTVNYNIINGALVTLDCGTCEGTSNATFLQMSGLPALLQPARLQYLAANALLDNGANAGPAYAVVTPAGSVLNFYKSPALIWTASGQKGINALSLTYPLV